MDERLATAPPLTKPVPLTDGDLVSEFLRQDSAQSERAEWAMKHLVERHSPMVLGVCRRALGEHADAEDAAQAVFLVLARKASSLKGDSLGGWLHRTATLVCRNAIRTRRVRQHHEARAAAMSASPTTTDNVDWSAIREVLDAELDRLPEKYRIPLILFHLENRSLSEISQLMAVSAATIGTWLSRARELLASRLTRRGITVGAVALAGGLSSVATAAPITPAFVASTVTAAGWYGAGHLAIAGGLSSSTSALAGSCLQVGPWATLKVPLAVIVCGLVLGTIVIGVALTAGRSLVLTPDPAPPSSPPTTAELSTGAAADIPEEIAGLPLPIAEESDPLYGGISGQILCTGPVPARQGLLNPKDESLLVDPVTQGVSNVFVFLRKPPAQIAPQFSMQPPKRLVVDNVGAVSVPHAWIAHTNQSIVFKNGCPFSINVHTNPVQNVASNFVLKPMDRIGTAIVWDKPEAMPFRIVDDIHASASCYALVLDHPYAAMTDTAGKFYLPHLPTGNYRFRVWHERVGYIEREYQVTVTGGQLTALPALTVPSSKFVK